MIVQSIKQKRKPSDPAATRTNILDASMMLFSQHGYHAVTIAQISEAAVIPKSLIAYHFGNKEELWGEVVTRFMTPALDTMDLFLSGEILAADLIRVRFSIFSQNPNLARFIAWASLTEIPLPTPLRDRKVHIQERVRSTSSESIQNCLLAISLMDGWFLNKGTYALLFGEEGISLMTQERLHQEIEKLIEVKQ